MKSGSSITLTKSWWTKEAPEGLKKSDKLFEKAVESFAKAESAAKTPTDKTVEALEQAAEELQDAGDKVVTECKELLKEAKKAKDKARTTDLENTIKVMGGPLSSALQTALEAIPDPDGPDEDEEPDANVFTDPELHATYLKKKMGKLKRKPYTFAIGLPTNDPGDMRMNLHPKKAGRGLAGVLKKQAGAKKFTFGRAGGLALAEEYDLEGITGRTLVIELQGRRIPSLAKRMKLFLKRMRVTAFGVVTIIQNGQVIETADETTPDDAPLEEIDVSVEDELDEDTEGDTAPTPPPAPPPMPESDPTVTAEARRRRLEALIRARAGDVQAETDPERKAKLAGLLKTAKSALDKDEFDAAEKAILAFGKLLAGGGDKGDLIKRLTGLVPRIQTYITAHPDQKGQVQGLVSNVKEKAKVGDTEAGEALFRELVELLERTDVGDGGISVAKLGKARVEWITVRQTAHVEVGRLKEIISEAYEGDTAAAGAISSALGRLDTAIGGFDEALETELDGLLSEEDPGKRSERAKSVKTLAEGFLNRCESDPVLAAIDGNEFDETIVVIGPMRSKLAEITSAIGV